MLGGSVPFHLECRHVRMIFLIDMCTNTNVGSSESAHAYGLLQALLSTHNSLTILVFRPREGDAKAIYVHPH